MKLFRKKYKKGSEPLDCFTTIDELPIKIWFAIHVDGDYTKLLRNNEVLTDASILRLSDIWNNLYNDFIKRFGLSDEFMADLRDDIKLANLQAEYIITGQRYLTTLIKIEQEKRRLLDLEVKAPIELESILAKMSKYYGFKLSSRDLTTVEYYSYINNILDGNKN